MNKNELLNILNGVKSGELSPADAVDKIKLAPYEDIGFANVDTSRSLRHGVGEVIYGEGKTAEQIAAICQKLLNSGEQTVLITRIDESKAEYVSKKIPLNYEKESRTAIAGIIPKPDGKGKIVVCCAGTSDLYCAKEAVRTARAFGNEVETMFDVGVAGIHRLLDKAEILSHATAVVAVAGMEGALASVVGGLASCPVIAVPTSVGYGASFGGVSALLAMLNSCASNVSVVNIDNGFGAAYIASMINHEGCGHGE